MRKLDLHDKGHMVEALWNAVNHGSVSLEHVPMMIQRVIQTEAWRERVHDEKIYHNATFLEFITGKPLAGCGWPLEKVEALLKDEPQVLVLWREATKLGQGKRTDIVDIVNEVKPSKGNSRAYTLDRLKRERSDLFSKVCAGELSANAAAIEAGFRKQRTPLETILKLLPKLTPTERRQLVARLNEFLRVVA